MAPNLRYKIDELVSQEKMSFDEIVKGNQLTVLWNSHYQQYLEKINNLFSLLFKQSGEIKYQDLQNNQSKQRTVSSLPI